MGRLRRGAYRSPLEGFIAVEQTVTIAVAAVGVAPVSKFLQGGEPVAIAIGRRVSRTPRVEPVRRFPIIGEAIRIRVRRC